jgi:hypothetical protein
VMLEIHVLLQICWFCDLSPLLLSLELLALSLTPLFADYSSLIKNIEIREQYVYEIIRNEASCFLVLIPLLPLEHRSFVKLIDCR